MSPVLVSAASRPAPATQAARRTPLRTRSGEGDPPPTFARILPPDSDVTPIVAAFQSSV